MDLAMAQRLVDRRKAAGLSQEALATQLGVSRQAVSKWERSESSPDTDNLIALAALYGVSLDELLYGAIADARAVDEGAAPSGGIDEPKSTERDTGVETRSETSDAAASSDTTDEPSPASDPQDGTEPHASKPTVDISWRKGIHVVDPQKGEEVHVGWRGIHVDNDRKNEHVHIGPGGMHIDTPEDGDGHSVRTNEDGTVTIDGKTYASWKDAHDELDHHGGRFRTGAGRAWNKFPFPAVVALVYLVLGIGYGTWGIGLFLVFLVPAYYAIGDFIDRRELGKLIGGLYAPAALAWFCHRWLCLGQPHPAWLILLTIPLVHSLMRWCHKQWKHRCRRPAR